MRGFSFFQESIGEECEAEEGRGRERKRESLCRFNILTDESPLAMLRMEIVGPDSAVTARRQIINFSLDAKRIPLSVCSPPPSSVCLPFFASVVSSIGLSLSRCLFDFAKWKNFSRMQEEKLTGGRGSRPCRPFYSNFFLSSLPLSNIFTATHAWTQDSHTIPPSSLLSSLPYTRNPRASFASQEKLGESKSRWSLLLPREYKFPRLEVAPRDATTWRARLT